MDPLVSFSASGDDKVTVVLTVKKCNSIGCTNPERHVAVQGSAV